MSTTNQKETPTISFDANSGVLSALEFGSRLSNGQDLARVGALAAFEVIEAATDILASPKDELALEYPYIKLPDLRGFNERLQINQGSEVFKEMFIDYDGPPEDFRIPVERHIANAFMALSIGLINPPNTSRYEDEIDFLSRWPGRLSVPTFLYFDMITRLSVSSGGDIDELRVIAKYEGAPPPSKRIVAGIRNGELIVDSTKDSSDNIREYSAELREKAAELVGHAGTRVTVNKIKTKPPTGRFYLAGLLFGTKRLALEVPPESRPIYSYTV